MSPTATLLERPTRASRHRAAPAPASELEGDASVHLEDLVVGALAPFETAQADRITVEIELVGPHLRVAGTMTIGQHRRLSDFVNHHHGLLEIQGATVLRRNGDATRVTTPRIWSSPAEVTLIGQTTVEDFAGEVPPEFRIPKVAHTLVVVTPGHTLTGNVHIPAGAELTGFIESNDPPFIPMTDVRTRSLADRRIIARYPFAVLNRRHMVAATELQPGMIPGRTVL